MSEHAWVLENLASYNAGGLEAAERERLQIHIAACAPCAEALNEARDVDRTLEALFAEVSPDPALEDRLIHSLRAGQRRRRRHSPLSGWIAGSAAAVVLLGALGAGVNKVIGDGDLPFPGMTGSVERNRARAENNLHQIALAAILSESRYSSVFEDKPATDLRSARELAEQLGASSLPPSNDGKPAEPPRKRAVALNVNSQSMAGGFVLPQSHVDIVSVTGSNNGECDSKTILQNIPVLAVDQSSSKPEDGKQATVATTVTVEVTPEQAEQLALAQKMGTLSVIQRSFGDYKVTTRPVTSEGRQLNPYINLLARGGETGDSPTAESYFKPSELTGLALQDRKAPEKKPGGESERLALPKLEGNQGTSSEEKLAPKAGQPASPIKRLMSKLRTGVDYFDPNSPALEDPKASEKKPEGEKGDRHALPKLADDQGKASQEKKPPEAASPSPAPVTPRKIVIRSGEIEFEIESFDAAVAAVTRLIGGIKNGFVATVNSEKLANGKVRGAVVVRVPPENLDTLIADLRKELSKAGELKSQRIGSQDISKQYTDLESRLRAARAMEERLLQIIKSGKGEIKDLLQAEKELGAWRTKIEEIEGELRYYANLVALSTLTITLVEKEIRAPSAITETERIQMGLEVEDVDKARQQALDAVADAKGRITKSELKQYAAGQYSAFLQFEVAPEAAGPLRDRLKQLGTLARLEIDRLQQTEGGNGPRQDTKLKRNDAQFLVSLYNLAKVEPREIVNINLACVDVEAVYQTILTRVHKMAGRTITSNLNRLSKEQTTGMIKFEVRAAEADAVLQNLKEAGEVMRLQVTANPDIQNTTRSKRGFNVSLAALDQVEPREKADLQVATRDVPAGYRALLEAVARAKGRMLNAQLNEQDRQNITAQLDFDVRRPDEAAIEATLSKIGDAYSRNVVRAQDNENVTDSKVRLKVTLLNVARIPPRATYTLAVEVGNVDNTAGTLSDMVHESQGRTVESHVAHRPNGSVVAKQVFDVPLAVAPALLEKFKGTGTVRVEEASRNPQVPDTALAVARLDVTLSNEKLIVPSDDGLWPQVRKGLSNSLLVIFWSLSWVIFGLLVVLPWALLIYGIYRLVMRLRKKPGSATTTA